MVFVVNAASVGQNLGLKPLPHIRRWRQAYAEVSEVRQLKQ